MHASGSDDQEKELSRLKKEQRKLKKEIKLLESFLLEAATLTDMAKASKKLQDWVADHETQNFCRKANLAIINMMGQ